jgi:hypothetical protein
VQLWPALARLLYQGILTLWLSPILTHTVSLGFVILHGMGINGLLPFVIPHWPTHKKSSVYTGPGRGLWSLPWSPV